MRNAWVDQNLAWTDADEAWQPAGAGVGAPVSALTLAQPGTGLFLSSSVTVGVSALACGGSAASVAVGAVVAADASALSVGQPAAFVSVDASAGASVSGVTLEQPAADASVVAMVAAGASEAAFGQPAAVVAVVSTGDFYPVVSGDDGYCAPGINDFGSGSNELPFGLAGNGWSYSAFVRFPGVRIPPGATITSATWKFRAWTASTSEGNYLQLHLQDADDAVAPTSVATFNALPLTTKYAAWRAPTTTRDAFYSSPDIAAVVQEVVDRAGWSAGNALMLVVKDVSPAGSTGYLNAHSIDDASSPLNPSSLRVEWTTAAVQTVEAGGSTVSFSQPTAMVGAPQTIDAGVQGVAVFQPGASVSLSAWAQAKARNIAVTGHDAQVSFDGAAAVSEQGLSLAQPGAQTVQGAFASTDAQAIALAQPTVVLAQDSVFPAQVRALSFGQPVAMAGGGAVVAADAQALALAGLAAGTSVSGFYSGSPSSLDLASVAPGYAISGDHLAGASPLRLSQPAAQATPVSQNDALCFADASAMELEHLSAAVLTEELRKWAWLSSGVVTVKRMKSRAAIDVSLVSRAKTDIRITSKTDAAIN